MNQKLVSWIDSGEHAIKIIWTFLQDSLYICVYKCFSEFVELVLIISEICIDQSAGLWATFCLLLLGFALLLLLSSAFLFCDGGGGGGGGGGKGSTFFAAAFTIQNPSKSTPTAFFGGGHGKSFLFAGYFRSSANRGLYFVKVLTVGVLDRDPKFRAWSGGGLIGTANRYLAVGSTNPFPAVATGFEAIWKAKMLQRTMFLYCTCLHEFWKSRLHFMHIDIALPLEKDFQQQILFSFHRHQSFDPQTKRKSDMCSWHIPSSITI